MLWIAFDLRRSTFVALNEYREAAARPWDGRREEGWQSGDDVLGPPVVGKDFHHRPATAREPGQAEGGGHQLQEAATIGLLIWQMSGHPRELAFQEVPKLRRIGQLFEAAPAVRSLAQR